jgi:hypothetical protein
MLKYYGMCSDPDRLSNEDWAREYAILKYLRKDERNESLKDQAKLFGAK